MKRTNKEATRLYDEVQHMMYLQNTTGSVAKIDSVEKKFRAWRLQNNFDPQSDMEEISQELSDKIFVKANTIKRNSKLFNLFDGQKMVVYKWGNHIFKNLGLSISDEIGYLPGGDKFHAAYGLLERETEKRWVPSSYIEYVP